MPRWDYKCPKCNKVVERLWPNYLYALAKTVLCEDCDLPMERQPCSGSFILKGAGFHANDYPNK